jgi:hypothetical protein
VKKRKRRPKWPAPSELSAAIAWYRADQWDRLREISADRDQLDETYAEWVVKAQGVLDHLAGEGLSIDKVEIDLDDLQRWCAERGIPINGQARASYAAEKAREREQGHPPASDEPG